jgi:hypothetical protein
LVAIAAAAIWKKSQAASPRVAEFAAEVGLLTETGIRNAATVEELERTRETLQSQFSAADTMNRIRLLKLRIATADRGFEIANSKTQRNGFQLDQLQSLLALCWIQRTAESAPADDIQRLWDLSESLLSDADPEIARTAHHCKLMLAAMALLRNPESLEIMSGFKNAIELVAGKFSDDAEIVSDIRLILDGLVLDARTGNELFELMRFISANYKNSGQKVIRDWSATLRDQTFFAENDFFYKVELCQKGAESACDVTLDSVPWLLGKNLSPFGLQRLLTVANIFESKNKLDHAKRLYRIILDWMSNVKIDPEMEQIRIACKFGIQRIESMGKPFRVEGIDIGNEPLKSEAYNGKVVLVLFVGDKEAIAMAKQRAKELKSLEKHGMKMIVVGLGFDSAGLQTAIGKSTESTAAWIADKDRDGPFFQQSPAAFLPYGMIVDRQGNVAKLGVHGEGLSQEMESMVFAK